MIENGKGWWRKIIRKVVNLNSRNEWPGRGAVGNNNDELDLPASKASFDYNGINTTKVFTCNEH